MSSNNLRLKISNRDLEKEYSLFLTQKADVVIALYKKYGQNITRALIRKLPKDTGYLASLINYHVYAPRSSITGLIRYITLSVGLLNVHDRQSGFYLNYILYGSRSHVVPEYYNGHNTGIYQWAERHGLITQKEGFWVWAKGKLEGHKVYGIPVKGWEGQDYFSDIYERYNSRLRTEIRRILKE